MDGEIEFTRYKINARQQITYLLGKVLEITLGEGDVGGDNELRLGSLDGHIRPEIAGLAVHLVKCETCTGDSIKSLV